MKVHKNSYTEIAETTFSTTLQNGLTITLLPKQEMSKTFAIFSTNYGSIDRTFIPYNKNEKITVPDGVAHFLEHKLFEKEDRDVFADFSKLGASPNAYTSFTNTAYLFSATKRIEENVEILLDFVQSPYFSDESVEKEKGIIEQEINMYNDDPDWRSFMGTIEAMFQDHPVRIDIAGTVDSVYDITKEDLYTCYETFYHPANMVLFIIGNFNVESIMNVITENQAKKSFQSVANIERYFPNEDEQVAEELKYIHMPVSIPKCTVGIKESVKSLRGKSFLKKDMLLQMIVDHYFSKGGSFYQKLYEENLIDNSFYYRTSLERNFGYTLIGGNTEEPERFGQKVKQLLLSTNEAEFTKEDVETMKRKRIGQILRAMNSLEYIANEYIHYFSVDVDFLQIIPEIQALTKEDFTTFLSEWISEDRISVCTVSSE